MGKVERTTFERQQASPGSDELEAVGLAEEVAIRRKRDRSYFRRFTALEPYLYILPAMSILITFVLLPLLYAFYLSLTDWDLISPVKNFVGLRNYQTLFRDSTFWRAFRHTLTFTLGTVPTQMALALAVALLLNAKIRFQSFFRSLYFLPVVVPITVVAIVWLFIFSPTAGLSNILLRPLGVPALNWFNNPERALLAIMLMTVWKNFGFHTVLFVAGLQAIPRDLSEAAAVDGANRWHSFWRITFPLLMPTTFLSLILSTIGSFKAYEAVVLTTNGGPAGATSLIVFELYRTAFEYFNMGYAAAMAYVIFAVLFALTLLQFRVIGSRIYYA